MRIRKRPPLLPFSSSPSQNPDPCLQLEPPNGRGTKFEKVEEKGGREPRLHPDGDLLVEAQYERRKYPAPSNPHPKSTHSKVVKEGDAQVDSSNRSRSSSSAQVPVRNDAEKKAKLKAKSTPITVTLNTSNTDDRIVNCKKRKSPAVLMEGSRCSRVNGRGWRCCQQTLVGYSLCEHHLGKGRLKSVSSVRGGGQALLGNSTTTKSNKDLDDDWGAAVILSSLQKKLVEKQRQPQQEVVAGVENGMKNGRKKVGMVKARSISSLLHEIDHPSMISSTVL